MEKKKKTAKYLVLSLTAGIAAVLIFLYTYYYLLPGNEKAARDGAVVYTARTSSAAGVDVALAENERLSLELRTDGICFLTNQDGSLRGKWNLDGNRLQVSCGKVVLYGTMSEGQLRLHEINGRAVELLLTSDEAVKEFAAEKLSGEWRLVSITEGEDIYEKSRLRASGYDISRLKFSADGSGSALFADGIEKPLRLGADSIEYDGRQLSYSFTDTQLTLQYTDSVLFVFEKDAAGTITQ